MTIFRLTAASGATATLTSKRSQVLGISDHRGEVGSIPVQAAGHHRMVPQSHTQAAKPLSQSGSKIIPIDTSQTQFRWVGGGVNPSITLLLSIFLLLGLSRFMYQLLSTSHHLSGPKVNTTRPFTMQTIHLYNGKLKCAELALFELTCHLLPT